MRLERARARARGRGRRLPPPLFSLCLSIAPVKSARVVWFSRFHILGNVSWRVASSSTTSGSAVTIMSRPAAGSSRTPSRASLARPADAPAGRRRLKVGPQALMPAGVSAFFHRWYMPVTPPSSGVAPRARRRALPRMGRGRGPMGTGARGVRAAASGDRAAPPAVANRTTRASAAPAAPARASAAVPGPSSALEQARKTRTSPATAGARALMTAATSASQSPWRGKRKFLPAEEEAEPSSRKTTTL